MKSPREYKAFRPEKKNHPRYNHPRNGQPLQSILTAKIEVGGDDEEIRKDDGDAEYEDEARLQESLQRGLLHAAGLSRCIPLGQEARLGCGAAPVQQLGCPASSRSADGARYCSARLRSIITLRESARARLAGLPLPPGAPAGPPRWCCRWHRGTLMLLLLLATGGAQSFRGAAT